VKNTYEITLLNQKFNLKSDSDEKHVQKVADFVNRRIFEIQEKTKSVSSLNVALLAALNIADDFFKIKKTKQGKSSPAKNKLKEILNYVDQCLEEG